MKSERKSRNAHKKLYLQLEQSLSYEDTRYWGLFQQGERVGIDPIRYQKTIGNLSNEQLTAMANRNTHLFYPKNRLYSDYNWNYFRDSLNEIKSQWKNDFQPIVEAAIKRIKSKKYNPGQDVNFQSGISSYGAASARSQWLTIKSAWDADRKRYGLATSFYAQFFHLLASQIEATTVKVLHKNNVLKDSFSRNILYNTCKGKNVQVINFEGFAAYDKTYCIWNFIKHNNQSTFATLLDRYCEVIRVKDYKQGDLAIYYLVFSEDLILSLIDGVLLFFKDYCKYVFDENPEDAVWNYDGYFVSAVNSEIENLNNPLGLDMFDDID